jgi:hypothetical protein
MSARGQSQAGTQLVTLSANQTHRRYRRRQNQNTRQPLLYAALALGGGIVVGSHCWRPALWWVIAVIVFSGSTLYFLKHRPRVAPILTPIIWFCLGALNLQVHQRPQIPNISLCRSQRSPRDCPRYPRGLPAGGRVWRFAPANRCRNR